MKKISRYTIMVLLAVVLIATSHGWSWAEQKEFKVGFDLTFSGPAGSWGVQFSNGCKLVADYINAEGGLTIGGEKYKIVFFEGDDQFTAEGAATVARRLIEKDKVNMIVGSIVTQTTLGMQEVTEPAKMITLNTAYSDDTIFKAKGKRYSFRAGIWISETMPSMFKWLRTNYPDYKKIAMIDLNYDSAWISHDKVKQIAPKFGLEIAYEGYWEGGTKDYFPWLLKAQAKGYDVLYNASSLPEFALLVKQARQLGFKGLPLMNIPMDYNMMSKIAGAEALEGDGLADIAYLTSGPGVNDRTKKFIADYAKKHDDWSPNALLVAPAFHAMLQAYEIAGTLDPDGVLPVLQSDRKWITSTGYDGSFSGECFYGHKRQWLSDLVISQVKDKKVVPVHTISVEDMNKGYQDWN